MALTDPAPSQAIDVFKRNMEDVDSVVNNTSGTVTNRTGKTMRPLPVISDAIEQQITDLTADINAAKADLYPIVKFRFLVDSYTITNRNELGDTATGETYRYVGAALPFNVTPATNPVGNPDFVQVIQTDHNNLTNRNAVEAHDAIYTRNFNTVTDLRLQTDASGNVIDLSLLEGLEIKWSGYYNKHDGGGSKGVVRIGNSSILTDDGGSIFVIVNDTANGVWVEANLSNKVNSKKFGVVSDGIADDTARLEALVNYLDSIGGGVCQLSKGVFNLSIANSSHNFVCWLIPENVTVRGRGKVVTKIQRLPSERGLNGVLLCNKNYDINTNYEADGNIIIEHLTIDEGAVTPTKAGGDLIGFGNGDGLIVRYCHFGNHDQHAVDIARSRNVDVYENTSNNQVNATESATYQVDAGLIIGIAGPNAKSYNVNIHHNRIFDSKAARVIHYHTGENAENVHIYCNTIHCPSLPENASAIEGDIDTSFSNSSIYKNDIKLYKLSQKGINLPSQDTVEVVRNLKIYENSIRGVFRVGIYVGDDSPSKTDTNGPLFDVEIRDNFIDANLSIANAGADIRLIAVSAFKYAKIINNKFNVFCGTQAQSGAVKFIDDRDCENIEVSGNSLIRSDLTDFTNSGLYGVYSRFTFHKTNNLKTNKFIKDNFISINNANYHIFFEDVANVDTYTGLSGSVSMNRMVQTVKSANIKEIIPISDGTNNLGYVNFSAHGAVAEDVYTKEITSASSYQNIPLTGTKQAKDGNRRTSKTTLDIIYSPLSASSFGNDSEVISNAYISPTQCVGTIIKDIDIANGHFDIVTGSDGVSMVINDSTFQPVLRTSGFIKILCGI